MNKFVILFCGIALMVVGIQAGAIPAEFEEPAREARKVCFEETGIDDETHAKFVAGNFVDDDKCYFKCVIEQFGLRAKDKVNFDMMIKILPASIREKGTIAIENCRSTTGKDLCEQAYSVVKCLYSQDPEDFFVV